MMPPSIAESPPIHVAEFAWLTSDEASRWLEELSQSELPIHVIAANLRRNLSANRTHLLLEQMELRRRGAAKFTRAAQMLFTARALEQATDEWIARHKARRFHNRTHVADLCCGIGGDAIGLSGVSRTTAVDRNPNATCCAAHNVAIYRTLSAPDAAVEAADVEIMDVGDFDAWHLDPDRRPQGRRTTRVELHEPSLLAIEKMLLRQPNAAIKLAPAANLPRDSAWSAETEFEWISRGGECRQLVAWRGGLATKPGFRRATRISPAGSATFVGLSSMSIHTAERVERFVYEPDTSILAAHLTGALGSKLGLQAVAAGVAYLTGNGPVSEPLLSAFEVIDTLPFDRRQLAAYLQERSIGRVEIKHRGLKIDPNSVRRELKLRGDNEATLIVTKIAQRATVLIASRIPQRGSDEASRDLYAEASTNH